MFLSFKIYDLINPLLAAIWYQNQLENIGVKVRI